jgi:hypothetical protein
VVKQLRETKGDVLLLQPNKLNKPPQEQLVQFICSKCWNFRLLTVRHENFNVWQDKRNKPKYWAALPTMPAHNGQWYIERHVPVWAYKIRLGSGHSDWGVKRFILFYIWVLLCLARVHSKSTSFWIYSSACNALRVRCWGAGRWLRLGSGFLAPWWRCDTVRAYSRRQPRSTTLVTSDQVILGIIWLQIQTQEA